MPINLGSRVIKVVIVRAGVEWVRVLAVHTSHMVANVLFNLSELQPPHLQNRANAAYISGLLCGLNEINVCKVLRLHSTCSLNVSHSQSYPQP